MLFDMENNQISLSRIPNSHIVVLGRSGSGKTYFLCRQIEEEYAKGKKVLIFDYSSSYTEKELEKSDFRYQKDTHVSNPFKESVNWIYRGRNIQLALTNAILRGLGIKSYYQKKLLEEAIKKLFSTSKNKCFSFLKLKEIFVKFSEIKEDKEQENVFHLLTRIEPYADISNLEISEWTANEIIQKNINIVQLSDFPRMQRQFIVEFLTEILWEEVWGGYKRADIVLLDEFQNLSIRQNSILATMLREGRKFDLSLYLSTQFFGDCSVEEKDTLMQAGNMLFFRPTSYDTKFVSNLLDPDDTKIWRRILNNLQRGEAVLKGNFSLNNRNTVIDMSIICKVGANQVSNI